MARSVLPFVACVVAAAITASCTSSRPPYTVTRRSGNETTTTAPAAASSSAAPASSASAPDNPRASLHLAEQLMSERKYAEALVAYEQAYRLGHEPSALRGGAECLRALNRVGSAYESYELLLSAHDAQLSADEKRTAQAALQELGAVTASLVLDVSEPDAEIDLDGKSWGRSPMAKPRRVRATTHTLHVSKAGFTTFEVQLVLAGQEHKKVDVKLEADRAAGTQSMSEAERKAAARAAFAEGVKLQDQKDYVQALSRFETAERLHDAPTHLLHVAQCQAASGKLVEAQETYATLGHLALPAGSPDAFRAAQETGRAEAPKLKPRVPTLRLQTVPPAATLKNLVVQVNGVRLPADLLGIARPVNPGTYRVSVTANGQRSATAEVELKEGETRSLDLRLGR